MLQILKNIAQNIILPNPNYVFHIPFAPQIATAGAAAVALPERAQVGTEMLLEEQLEIMS